VREVSCLEDQDRMKKYRSEEYMPPASEENTEQEESEEEQSPLPRLLADKYLRNEFNRKFSTSQHSERDEIQFKPILNEVHVVPYKIN
jgi:hypothetical protein